MLQIVFSFFLGLVVTAFIGIGVNTFYPEPDYSLGSESSWNTWPAAARAPAQ